MYIAFCWFLLHALSLTHGRGREKPDFVAMKIYNNGADQTAHMHCLISTFVISSLESIRAKLATCKVTIF